MPRPPGTIGGNPLPRFPAPIVLTPPGVGATLQLNYQEPIPLTGFDFPAGPPVPPGTVAEPQPDGPTKLVKGSITDSGVTAALFTPAATGWSWDKLYDGTPTLDPVTRQPMLLYPPLADFFTQYALATLCRAAYNRDSATDTYIGLAFPGAQLQYVPCDSSHPPFAVWVMKSGSMLVVFPGTTTAAQWASYLAPFMVPDPALPDSLFRAYNGILRFARAYSDAFKAWAGTNVPDKTSIIFAGHSAGGAAAQLAAWWYQSTKGPNGNNPNVPIVPAVYTFGTPAWSNAGLSPAKTAWGQGVVRIYSWPDPVPWVVQNWIDAAGIIKRGYLTAGVLGFQAGVVEAFQSNTSVEHIAAVEVPSVSLTWPQEQGMLTLAARFMLPLGIADFASQVIKQHQMVTYCTNLALTVEGAKMTNSAASPFLAFANAQMSLYEALNP